MPQVGEIKRGCEIGRKGREKLIWSACLDCGKERWVELKNGEPVHKLCRRCSNKAIKLKIKGRFTGSNNAQWKGGRRIARKGYILIWVGEDDFFAPMRDKRLHVVPEHRLVIAKSLGRNLHSWEIVHHKHTRYLAGSIEDKQDNRRENLQLVTDDRHKQITILELKIEQQAKEIKCLKEQIKTPQQS